jgi:hypothetical protein
MIAGGIGFKAQDFEQPLTIAAADIRRLEWARSPRGWCLRVTDTKGDVASFEGMRREVNHFVSHWTHLQHTSTRVSPSKNSFIGH